MKGLIDKIISKNAFWICAVVFSALPYISESCHGLWYQPEEPEEVRRFLNRKS
ncbi:MAG: cyclic lactone autoinducer peptide [Lachnospiraceae bacterium]|nr:cyclic lactone autoinducer peptide [Lachnospiraceae bacterium]MBO6300246.1 cyclic lactone autoinducer peptide [Lachnospiraceae bacterium]